jgi:hypothetical protein
MSFASSSIFHNLWQVCKLATAYRLFGQFKASLFQVSEEQEKIILILRKRGL